MSKKFLRFWGVTMKPMKLKSKGRIAVTVLFLEAFSLMTASGAGASRVSIAPRPMIRAASVASVKTSIVKAPSISGVSQSPSNAGSSRSRTPSLSGSITPSDSISVRSGGVSSATQAAAAPGVKKPRSFLGITRETASSGKKSFFIDRKKDQLGRKTDEGKLRFGLSNRKDANGKATEQSLGSYLVGKIRGKNRGGNVPAAGPTAANGSAVSTTIRGGRVSEPGSTVSRRSQQGGPIVEDVTSQYGRTPLAITGGPSSVVGSSGRPLAIMPPSPNSGRLAIEAPTAPVPLIAPRSGETGIVR